MKQQEEKCIKCGSITTNCIKDADIEESVPVCNKCYWDVRASLDMVLTGSMSTEQFNRKYFSE